ncbi:uncharacterized protein [Argopecten irradians]|uniref:uncharacterized protein n=1 Tax=Argopecten irradians TaxID=31199 RepID=UPI003718EDD1
MALSSTLKRSFSDTTIRQLVIYATIASNEEHKNHAIGENAGYCQPLDGDIIRKIKELAEEGHRKVTSIKLLLAQYVQEHLAPGIPETNRRFYPTSKDIRNHIYHTVVGGSMESSEEDQMDVVKLVEELKSLHPQDRYFFRPASSSDDTIEPLLLVIQTEFQRQM